MAGLCHCTPGTPGRTWLAVTSCWTSSARPRTLGTLLVPEATPLPPEACRCCPRTPVPACSCPYPVVGDPHSHPIIPCHRPSPLTPRDNPTEASTLCLSLGTAPSQGTSPQLDPLSPTELRISPPPLVSRPLHCPQAPLQVQPHHCPAGATQVRLGVGRMLGVRGYRKPHAPGG